MKLNTFDYIPFDYIPFIQSQLDYLRAIKSKRKDTDKDSAHLDNDIEGYVKLIELENPELILRFLELKHSAIRTKFNNNLELVNFICEKPIRDLLDKKD